MADRLLIKPRAIDFRTGVFAAEVTPGEPGIEPVTIKIIDAKTKEHKETLEVDACLVATGRAPCTGTLGLAEVCYSTTLHHLFDQFTTVSHLRLICNNRVMFITTCSFIPPL